MKSGWRSAKPLARAAGRGPLILLLSGVGLGVAGLLLASYGVLATFQPRVDMPGGSSLLFVAIQWVGFLSISCGSLLVVASIVWWLWRVMRPPTR